MSTTETLDTVTARTFADNVRGSRLLLGGAAVYATAALAPFSQGTAVMDASRVSGDPLQAGSVSYTSTTSNPFEFLWTPGFSSFNGGLISYLQVASVFAMALVAILALLRLRRGGSQRSILSVVITGAVTAYLSYTWAHVASTPADPAAMVIEAYHFTPSLVVATVAALAATVGAVMATVRIESTDSAA